MTYISDKLETTQMSINEGLLWHIYSVECCEVNKNNLDRLKKNNEKSFRLLFFSSKISPLRFI
jgi:hypothetical protein